MEDTTNTQTAQECSTWTVEEAAKFYGISRASAYEAARRGEIPAVRIGGRVLIPIARAKALLAGERS